MIDWDAGYSAEFYLALVDQSTWRDNGRIEITGGKITKDEKDLRESADIDCVDYGDAGERWVRVWMNVAQGGNSDHVALYTGIACSPSVDIDGTLRQYPLECYSVLKPAQDVLLQRGWYAPAETNGAELVKELLSVSPCPIIIEGIAPALRQSIISEDGETNLSMADKVLTAINWRLQIKGDGTVVLSAKSKEAAAIFDTLEHDVIEPKISVDQDWYSCPNVFRAIQDEMTGLARDDDEKSPLSTVSRGREIWMEESGCALNDGETIEEYALRRLKEEQSVAITASYTRRFRPGVDVADKIRLHLPGQGIDGIFTVDSQSIDLEKSAFVSEKVSGVEYGNAG